MAVKAAELQLREWASAQPQNANLMTITWKPLIGDLSDDSQNNPRTLSNLSRCPERPKRILGRKNGPSLELL